MSDASRLKLLRIVLVVIGLFAIFGFYPLTIVWPSGWAWGHGHSHYLLMIIGVYATLGVFLLIASRDLCVPKTLSALFSGENRLTSAHNVGAVLPRFHFDLAIQVEEPA